MNKNTQNSQIESSLFTKKTKKDGLYFKAFKNQLDKFNNNFVRKTPILQNKKDSLTGAPNYENTNLNVKTVKAEDLTQIKKNVNNFSSDLLQLFNNSTYKEKLIFWAISFFLNKYRKDFYVSQSKIAKRAECSEKTIQRFMKKLRDIGIEISQRRNKGKFSTCEYDFNFEFKEALHFLVRCNLFLNIKNKQKYRKYLKNPLIKTKKLLTRYGSPARIYEAWNAYKKSKMMPGNHREMSDGDHRAFLFNISYKTKRFISKRRSVKIHKWIENLKIPDKEKLHFSKYSESAIIHVKEMLEFWLKKNHLWMIRSLPKFLQFLFNRAKKLTLSRI